MFSLPYLLRHRSSVCGEMLPFRHTSSTATPSSAWLRMKLNRVCSGCRAPACEQLTHFGTQNRPHPVSDGELAHPAGAWGRRAPSVMPGQHKALIEFANPNVASSPAGRLVQSIGSGEMSWEGGVAIRMCRRCRPRTGSRTHRRRSVPACALAQSFRRSAPHRTPRGTNRPDRC